MDEDGEFRLEKVNLLFLISFVFPNQISSEDIKVMSQSVTTTLQKKPVLHVACVEMLCQLIKKVCM